ncbi:hypothetical protein EVAR_80824_1 [Eumeta japonica]|uniref:Uncharacterized protein n=1 Tax=Eumeta variegata TaxID=151549 RepID=A0A4C1WCN0_EUMVA|nr:hypothetical protein EVAR_80824_1 [Eumeta japonica]
MSSLGYGAPISTLASGLHPMQSVVNGPFTSGQLDPLALRRDEVIRWHAFPGARRAPAAPPAPTETDEAAASRPSSFLRPAHARRRCNCGIRWKLCCFDTEIAISDICSASIDETETARGACVIVSGAGGRAVIYASDACKWLLARFYRDTSRITISQRSVGRVAYRACIQGLNT